MISNDSLKTVFEAPVRQIKVRAALFNGISHIKNYGYDNSIKSFSIERTGAGKFFGYGICQKLNIKLIDKESQISISTANNFRVGIADATNFYRMIFPYFYVSEVRRDETSGELSITAYDAIYQANKHTAEELTIKSYTIAELAAECARLIGVELKTDILPSGFDLNYPDGANLEGTETIREVLDAIAEATQSIYYLNEINRLIFKRLDKDGAAVYTIGKDKYFTLDSKTNRRLAAIAHTTELGDNVEAHLKAFTITKHPPQNITAKRDIKVYFTVETVGENLSYQWQYTANNGTSWIISPLASATTQSLEVPVSAGRNGYGYRCIITDANGKKLTSDAGYLTVLDTATEPIYTEGRTETPANISGTTQYIRNNPFYEMREDIDTLLNNALSTVGGLTINQFNIDWRGNCLLELGDKIDLVVKDGSTVSSFYLDDTLSYDGTLKAKTKWSYEDSEEETATNPVSIGDALKQTFARVDKANKQIELVASDVSENASAIASIQMNTGSINASVESIRKETEEALDTVNSNIGELTNKVNAQITAEDVSLSISSAMANGVSKVETETGFTFNKDGLTVSKSDSEISTQITEDGMRVNKGDDTVLTANNIGVEARNLHATTYLIIGNRSRFEDYEDNRTGCFWIGGE